MRFRIPTLIGALMLSSAGCNAIDNLADCQNICQRYHDCYDSAYDVGACRERCRSNSNNANFASNVNNCDACIGNRTCAGATFACAGQCASVVP